jgi:hypothetical protein
MWCRAKDLIAHPDISLVLQKRQVKQLSQVQAALAIAPRVLWSARIWPASRCLQPLPPSPSWDGRCCSAPGAEAYALRLILRTGILLLLGPAWPCSIPHRSPRGAAMALAARGGAPR